MTHLTGRHVLAIALGFLLTVMAVNGAFVWLALDTFSGVTSRSAYLDGLAYNDRLAAAATQRAQGWHGVLELTEGEVRLALRDESGQPIRGMLLVATLQRPLEPGLIFDLPLVETEPGRYAAAVALPKAGNWDLLVAGEAPDGRPFETRSRVWQR